MHGYRDNSDQCQQLNHSKCLPLPLLPEIILQTAGSHGTMQSELINEMLIEFQKKNWESFIGHKFNNKVILNLILSL